ncbi:MAG TPA: hypothetical protein VJ036_03475 [bacterium]|nr:hypothetical protein [bacterium]
MDNRHNDRMKKQTKWLKDYFTSGGTPPAIEQSARAKALSLMFKKENLQTKGLIRQLKRIVKQNR